MQIQKTVFYFGSYSQALSSNDHSGVAVFHAAPPEGLNVFPLIYRSFLNADTFSDSLNLFYWIMQSIYWEIQSYLQF